MPRLRRAVPWLLVAVAALLFVAPIDPALVERSYSGRLYLQLQPRVTALSNQLPFAVFDVLLVATTGVVIWTLAGVVRGLRRGDRWRALAKGGVRLLATGACLYIWFVGAWGLNYRRVPLLERLELANEAPTPAAVLSLGHQAVERLNELHAEAHAAPWIEPWQDLDLQLAFRVTQGLLGGSRKAVPGRLKRSLVGPYFRWASVDGMIDPFALEVLANPDLLPWERTFVAAHEWAHLAGYADESEANFVGWLTCLRADEAAQYSGWLYLYWQINGELAPQDRTELAKVLGEGPRRDIAAIVERLRRGQLPLLRNASLVVYDKYLRANRVEEGIRSYGEVVTLILRARFEDGWTPVRRDAR